MNIKMEKPIKFLNKKDQELFGIVHIPENIPNPSRKYGVILVHSANEGKIGHGRRYVFFARKLCSAGFYVLRFDPHGMGDSEGIIPTCPMSTFWSLIQTGLYVDDTITSIDYFTNEEGVQNITLIGLCAGAATAMLTAGRDVRVGSVIPISMPVIIDDPSIDYLGEKIASSYNSYLVNYIKKIGSLESWRNLLTFKTDYGQIARIFGSWLKKELKLSNKSADKKNEEIKISDRLDFNRYILDSFINFTSRGGRALFIYEDENSRSYREFRDEFQKRYLSQTDKDQGLYEIFTVKDANHLFTQRKWQEAVIERTVLWLKGYK